MQSKFDRKVMHFDLETVAITASIFDRPQCHLKARFQEAQKKRLSVIASTFVVVSHQKSLHHQRFRRADRLKSLEDHFCPLIIVCNDFSGCHTLIIHGTAALIHSSMAIN